MIYLHVIVNITIICLGNVNIFYHTIAVKYNELGLRGYPLYWLGTIVCTSAETKKYFYRFLCIG